MNNQERLFEAIGSAGPDLIARSERRSRSRWPGYCLAAAACLVLLLAASRFWSLRPDVSPPPVDQGPDSVPSPNYDSLLSPHGSKTGTLRLLSYAPQSQDEVVDFLIYVNEELFSLQEENGIYRIRNKNPLPEGFPTCGLDIVHMTKTTPEEAMREASKTFPIQYEYNSDGSPANCLPDSLAYRSGEGTDWDSEQAELWFVDDGHGGTFVLTSRYFLEAEEGMGTLFRDMVSSFRVISLDTPTPDWMRELYEAANQLFPALFANDLSSVSDFLLDGSEAEAYGEDVWADISIASVDYTLDSGQEPSSAAVSVKHRLNRVEGDSYSYLTMYLLRRENKWYLDWAGIEK